MSWVTIGSGLSGVAVLIMMGTLVFLTIKSNAANTLANSTPPKIDRPKSMKRMKWMREFSETRQKQEQHRKVRESMATPILYGSLVLLLSGLAVMVGIGMITIGFLQKYISW